MHHYRYADERTGTTTDHRNRRHYQQQQQQQHYNHHYRTNNNNNHQQQQQQQHHQQQHRTDNYGGRWTGGGDERWPVDARPPRRPYKKFTTFRKYDVGGGGSEEQSPQRSIPPSSSRCYRGETYVDDSSIEWDVMCKHFGRLNHNENGEKFKNRNPSSSIPHNHHLQYYSDLQKLHHVAYASRNTPTNIGKKQRPAQFTCNPWQYNPYSRPVYAYANKYCLSAPDMYASHAKDIAWDDLQITLDEEDQLSSDVWRKYLDGRQSESVYETKMDMWRKLSVTIKSLAPNCGLYMVGSTMNGFGGDVSDADFCLLTGCTMLSVDDRHRMCGIERLRWLANLLENGASFGATDVAIVYAKVPILRFQWPTAGGSDDDKIDVDLCCNHMVGIRNTHLLYCYSRLDYRVRPLVLTIKLWASSHNINDPKKMTLSSYSLVLMVINFLQCVKPAVVPSLQHIYGMKFSMHTDIEYVHMHEKLPRNSWRSENKQTLGELLLQFFEYYNNFNYYDKAVSVRTGGLLSLEYCRMAETEKNDPGQWKFIGIEEPFERTNTARSVHNHNVFNQIKEVISKSYDKLNETKSLNSIFCQIEQ